MSSIGERSRPGGPAKKSTGIDYHAGENETSNTMVSHPDLVHLDRATRNPAPTRIASSSPKRSTQASGGTPASPTTIPATAPSPARAWRMESSNEWIGATVEAIRAIKADDPSLKLQNEFYEKIKHPLDTKQ